MNTGFYYICEKTEEFGLGMNIFYDPEEDDIQLSMFIGNYILTVGYTFENNNGVW